MNRRRCRGPAQFTFTSVRESFQTSRLRIFSVSAFSRLNIIRYWARTATLWVQYELIQVNQQIYQLLERSRLQWPLSAERCMMLATFMGSDLGRMPREYWTLASPSPWPLVLSRLFRHIRGSVAILACHGMDVVWTGGIQAGGVHAGHVLLAVRMGRMTGSAGIPGV